MGYFPMQPGEYALPGISGFMGHCQFYAQRFWTREQILTKQPGKGIHEIVVNKKIAFQIETDGTYVTI